MEISVKNPIDKRVSIPRGCTIARIIPQTYYQPEIYMKPLQPRMPTTPNVHIVAPPPYGYQQVLRTSSADGQMQGGAPSSTTGSATHSRCTSGSQNRGSRVPAEWPMVTVPGAKHPAGGCDVLTREPREPSRRQLATGKQHAHTSGSSDTAERTGSCHSSVPSVTISDSTTVSLSMGKQGLDGQRQKFSRGDEEPPSKMMSSELPDSPSASRKEQAGHPTGANNVSNFEDTHPHPNFTRVRVMKLSDSAIVPTVAMNGVGLDLYSAFDYTIQPWECKIIRTDIMIKLEEDVYAQIRSGYPNPQVSQDLDVVMTILPPSFKGTVGVGLCNLTHQDIIIHKHSVVALLILQTTHHPVVVEVPYWLF